MTVHRREEVAADGTVTITLYDTTAGTVTVTVDGTQTEQRPITTEEAAQIDGFAQAQVEEANKSTLIEETQESIDTLLATIDALNAITALSNSTINQNPAAVIKDLTREVKTVARQVIRSARLISGSTESTDTGS